MTDAQLSVWPPLTPLAYAGRKAQTTPFPLQEPNCRLFVRARHALYAGVAALGLEPGDQVLVPAYHHGSEVEALRRAGMDCVFYGATPDLEPDQQELTSLIGPRTRALYLIDVLGFPRDAVGWRRWCDERGLLLIEDAAQAWLATIDKHPVGTHGDLSIYCLYKTLPLPYISAAVSRPPMQHPLGPRGSDLRRVTALHFAWASEKRVLVDRLTHRREAATVPDSRQPYSTEADFALADPTLRPGPWARFLLSRLAEEEPARARRENYRLLLEQLADLVPAPFGDLPDGASPFAFPVETSDKALLVQRLADRGIRAVNFWSTPHPSVPPDLAATAAPRRQSTIGLPVHQRLTNTDLDRIAEAVRPRTRRHDRLRVEQLDDLDALRPEWTTLAGLTCNIFASWEWHRTWWDHFGDDRSLALTTLRDESGALRALLPLYLWRERPLRIARFVGNRAGDQLGPICASSDEPSVSRAIRGLLRDAEWDLILGEQLPGDSAWGKRLSGHIVRREGSPVVRFQDSWEETTWSRRLRKELRRDERRLRDTHADVQVRTVTDKADLEAGLDHLFALHRARWPEGTRFERSERFHRDFARRAFDNGWLRLRMIEVDGEPAAARLGFRFLGVESGYQSGWDPQYADYSIGVLLVADTIRSAHSAGMKEYRFLRGGEAYKYRFANADPGLETAIFSRPSISGVAASGVTLARFHRP